MKTKLITSIFLAVMAAAMVGCLSTPTTEQDTKAAENDLQLQDFIKVYKLTATKAASGMYYYYTNQNPGGRSPQVGDLITVQYSIQNLSGVVLDSTSKAKNQSLTYAYSFESGISTLFYQGISLMKEGEKFVMLLPSQLAFGSNAYTNLPAYSPIRVELTLLKVRTEDETINEYITANKLVVTEKTTTGVRIIKNRLNPAGAIATSGLGVTLNYVGRLLYKNPMTKSNVLSYDDIFDPGAAPLTFQVGFKTVVDGFDEGCSKFRKGETGVIIFPSTLGYKYGSQTNILPGSPLRFDVDVTDVK